MENTFFILILIILCNLKSTIQVEKYTIKKPNPEQPFFYWTHIVSLSDTEIFFGKSDSNFIIDTLTKEVIQFDFNVNPYIDPFVFYNKKGERIIFELSAAGYMFFYGDDIDSYNKRYDPYVVQPTFIGFNSLVHFIDGDDHYVFYLYVSDTIYGFRKFYQVNKYNDPNYDKIRADYSHYENSMFGLAMKDVNGRTGLMIFYFHNDRNTATCIFYYPDESYVSGSFSLTDITFWHEYGMSSISITDNEHIICFSRYDGYFGCFHASFIIDDKVTVNIIKDFVNFLPGCQGGFVAQYQDGLYTIVTGENNKKQFFFFDYEFRMKPYENKEMFGIKIDDKYIDTAFIRMKPFEIALVYELEPTDPYLYIDYITLPKCSIIPFYVPKGEDISFAYYFENTLVRKVAFLPLGNESDNLFTDKKIRIGDNQIDFEEQYDINDIIMNIATLPQEISYVKLEEIPLINYVYPSPICKLTFNFCYKACMSCKEIGTFDDMKCNSCFDYLGYIEEKKECINCKTIDQYLDKNQKRCVPYLFRGYYVRYDDEYNILRECSYDCSLKQLTEEGIMFCKRYRTCAMLKIDEELTVMNYPVTDNTKILNAFFQMDGSKQYQKIDSLKNEIVGEKDPINIIQKSIVMNQLLNDTILSISYTQDVYNQIIENVINTINCEQIERFNNRNDIDSIFSTAYLYFYLAINQDLIQEQYFINITEIQKCLVKWGKTKLSSKSDSKKIDFVNILAVISSKMLNSLYNKTFIDSTFEKKTFKTLVQKYKKSIINTDVRKEIINTIEEILLLESSLNDMSYNKYKEVSFLTSKFSNFNLENDFTENNMMISIKEDCLDNKVIMKEIETLKYRYKICLPLELIKSEYLNANKMTVVEYAHYPLLNQNLTEFINQQFISINIRDENMSKINISKLKEPLGLVIKKPYVSFNECLFYDEEYKVLNNSNCKSINITENYTLCKCTHLTDFSISSLNPMKLLKDLSLLFRQIRIINSFEAFEYLDSDNAIILYTISSILGIFLLFLPFIIIYDIKHNENVFVAINDNPEDTPCCYRDDKAKEEINELKSKVSSKLIDADKVNNLSYVKKEIEMASITTEPKDAASFSQKAEISIYNPIRENKIKSYYYISKEFFTNDYFLLSFFCSNEGPMSKTNIFILFIAKLILSMYVSSLFTECNAKEEISNAQFNNRDLAVSIATILILEIPFMFFESMLNKKIIYKSMSVHINRLSINTLYRHILIYTLFVVLIIFGAINTTWLYLASEINGISCKIVKDFIITNIIDCFVYQVITLLVKAFIYEIIIMLNSSHWLRVTLFCIVSSIPWLFSIEG